MTSLSCSAAGALGLKNLSFVGSPSSLSDAGRKETMEGGDGGMEYMSGERRERGDEERKQGEEIRKDE